MKRGNLLLHIFSFCAFLWGLVFRNSALAVLGALPFWILLCTAIHEGGHCLGCALMGYRILEVRLPLGSIEGSIFSLRPAYSPVSYCRFRKGAKNWPVYLAGPVSSLLLWILLFLLCRRFSGWILPAGSIVAFLVLAANAIPFRRNDMGMVLRELFFRNENNT